LFKNLFKIVGIPAGYARTVDDDERVNQMIREVKFQHFCKKDKIVGFFRDISGTEGLIPHFT